MVIELSLFVPDELAGRLQEYKHGPLAKPDLRQLFGFETSDQIYTFLKGHDVCEPYTVEDVEREAADVEHLGY